MVNAYLLQFHMGNLANYCLDFALTLPYGSHLTCISTKTSKFIIYQFSFDRKINYCILFRAFSANNIIICILSCFLFGLYLFYHLKRYQFFLLPHGLIGHCRFAESWKTSRQPWMSTHKNVYGLHLFLKTYRRYKRDSDLTG